MRRIVRVIAAELHTRTGTNGIAGRLRKLEAHEMHGRGFLVVLAIQVFIGDRVDAGVPFHFHEHPVFHADEARQFAPSGTSDA